MLQNFLMVSLRYLIFHDPSKINCSSAATSQRALQPAQVPNAKKPAKKSAPVTVPRITRRQAAADASAHTNMPPDKVTSPAIISGTQPVEMIAKEPAAKAKRGRPAASKKATKG